MKQIILSTVSLAQSWLVEDLLDVLNQEKRVFVLTCIREEFQMIGESIEVLSQKEIARSLLRYGVLKTQITFCRLVEHNVSKIKRALENCDVFIFVGNDAHLAHHRLVDFHLISAVKHYEKTKILIGSMIYLFLEDSQLCPIESDLKSLTNFDVFLHYIESLESLRSILNVLEDKDRLVIALGENAGFIDEEGELFPLGDAYLFQPTQIDELYEAYHTYQES